MKKTETRRIIFGILLSIAIASLIAAPSTRGLAELETKLSKDSRLTARFAEVMAGVPAPMSPTPLLSKQSQTERISKVEDQAHLKIETTSNIESGQGLRFPDEANRASVFVGLAAFGFTAESDQLWSDVDGAGLNIQLSVKDKPRTYRTVKLNKGILAVTLARAPMEFTNDASRTELNISLPRPSGGLSQFRIVESPVLSSELGAKFPEIKTYSGQSLDDPTATVRFSWSPKGLNAFVISEQGTFVVAPISKEDQEHYLSYFTHDLDARAFECLTSSSSQVDELSSRAPDFAVTVGSLRRYRLAVSVTTEFISAIGGETVAGAGTVAAVTNYVNNVRAIYEREIGVGFTVVGIFNPAAVGAPLINATDPQQLEQMNAQHQAFLDVFWGNANYDIGTALGYGSQGPMGLADFGEGAGETGIGAACQTGYKGKASIIVPGPSTNDYWGSVVIAHELGHMFGGRHTFTPIFGSCVGDSQGKIEPGSGSTIMGYSGICGVDNLFTGEAHSAANSFFHIHSLLKIRDHKSFFSTCGQTTITSNSPPVITNGGAAATIPGLTPFTLTAAATDPNGDPLTYAWEEWDPGITFFRSYVPSSSTSRTFPSLTYILNNGNLPPTFVGGFFSGETFPIGSGTLNFTVTVRDNRSGGGGVAARDQLLPVNVVGSAGPFKVTQPNTAVALPSGGQTTITWNVANTNLSPISTAAVNILMSTDGGNTFPTILANSTPNNGSQLVTLPNVQTSTARIKIEAVGNIYFDISDTNFTITNSLPNLTPFKPTNWSAQIVVSNVSGTNVDSSPLKATDTLFVDWAVANLGTAPTSTSFFIKLFVDGVERNTWTSDPLNSNFFTFVLDQSIGSLSAGTHTITIVADPTGAVAETNETDNEFTKTITVSAATTTAQFSASTASVSETLNQTTKVNLTVTRTGVTSGAASVNYATSNGTASDRSDYLAALGTLNFAAGETSKTVSVFIVDDRFGEVPETFSVTLSNPVGCTLGSPSTSTVTINSNESVDGTNPVKDASFNSDFFVREHYVDFFNREADASGLAFWKNQIDSCTTQACRELRRINVSAAFFVSIEFQQTGYLVERLYKAAYGNGTGSSTLGGNHTLSVPIVRLTEFLADTQQIGRGVVIGAPGADLLLENNKQALIAEFVQRARFLTAFPIAMTPAAFVDKLNTNAGVVLSSAERNQLVNDLTSGAKTRAQVLRAVAEDSDLFSAETNRAFVLAQFFGYLRRNPNDSPDADYTGYDFWLGKLNQFNGNFVNAEMVKAFILSGEYQQRFGP